MPWRLHGAGEGGHQVGSGDRVRECGQEPASGGPLTLGGAVSSDQQDGKESEIQKQKA